MLVAKRQSGHGIILGDAPARLTFRRILLCCSFGSHGCITLLPRPPAGQNALACPSSSTMTLSRRVEGISSRMADIQHQNIDFLAPAVAGTAVIRVYAGYPAGQRFVQQQQLRGGEHEMPGYRYALFSPRTERKPAGDPSNASIPSSDTSLSNWPVVTSPCRSANCRVLWQWGQARITGKHITDAAFRR